MRLRDVVRLRQVATRYRRPLTGSVTWGRRGCGAENVERYGGRVGPRCEKAPRTAGSAFVECVTEDRRADAADRRMGAEDPTGPFGAAMSGVVTTPAKEPFEQAKRALV